MCAMTFFLQQKPCRYVVGNGVFYFSFLISLVNAIRNAGGPDNQQHLQYEQQEQSDAVTAMS